MTAIRYEHAHPGDLVHVDVKKIGRIPDGGGWRAHGRAMGTTAARRGPIGYDYVHSAVDDHSRLAYAEILPDEKGATTAAFIARALPDSPTLASPDQAIITDNHWSLPPHPRRGRGPGRARRQAPVHPAALPVAERQGRTVQPHPGHRL